MCFMVFMKSGVIHNTLICELFSENKCSMRNVYGKLHDTYIQYTRLSESIIKRFVKQSNLMKDRKREKYICGSRSRC